MVKVSYTHNFKKIFNKIHDQSYQKKIKTQMKKIIENPLIGKPMRYDRRESRQVYIKPYRLSYGYKNDEIIFLDIYHKDEQ
ncbi:MAG: type II toxin-antitoxin system RelE family toxin [Candidatus Woesearchaeota archaeon]